jgi:hypothetical protein
MTAQVSGTYRVFHYYLLRAYVCACGDVRWQYDMGVTTLPEIFQRRPDGCQYAVMRGWSHDFTDDMHMCVDLYDLRTTNGMNTLLGWHKTFPSLDAAIAAAQLNL